MHVLEVNGTDTLGAKPIRHSASDFVGAEIYDLSSSQAGLGIGRQRRFRPNYLYRRLAQLDSGSHAADHASASDRNEDGLDLRQVLQNLQPHRALARDDF